MLQLQVYYHIQALALRFEITFAFFFDSVLCVFSDVQE